MYDSVQYGRVGIYSKIVYSIFLLFQALHYHTLCPYSSILYTILHYISTLPYCTLSYILSLLFHTAHYHAFYHYYSLLYIILHSITTLPGCTVKNSSDRMHDSVQYGRVEIECKIVYSMEE
jgi:hypothetical protein